MAPPKICQQFLLRFQLHPIVLLLRTKRSGQVSKGYQVAEFKFICSLMEFGDHIDISPYQKTIILGNLTDLNEI